VQEQRDRVPPTAITRESVVEFLAEFTQNPGLRTASGPILLSECGLDSFGMFEFLLAFEERFGLQIEDAHFDPRTFESVDAIVAFARDRDVSTPRKASGRPE
jgi:acyl carrier protein